MKSNSNYSKTSHYFPGCAVVSDIFYVSFGVNKHHMWTTAREGEIKEVDQSCDQAIRKFRQRNSEIQGSLRVEKTPSDSNMGPLAGLLRLHTFKINI